MDGDPMRGGTGVADQNDRPRSVWVKWENGIESFLPIGRFGMDSRGHGKYL